MSLKALPSVNVVFNGTRNSRHIRIYTYIYVYILIYTYIYVYIRIYTYIVSRGSGSAERHRKVGIYEGMGYRRVWDIGGFGYKRVGTKKCWDIASTSNRVDRS